MNLTQASIIKNLSVVKQLPNESRKEFILRLIGERVNFINDYLEYSHADGYVVGLSGGVDSFVASMLIKLAQEKLINVLLPYGEQSDMYDVVNCQFVIKPYTLYTYEYVDIKPIVDKHIEALMEVPSSAEVSDLLKGNIMARERMSILYSYASIYNSLVVCTDHASESLTGFYTKWGDGAGDISPLSGLTKDIIYDMAEFFGAPKNILTKPASAGLWEGQTDEEELGLSYNDINKYLQGEKIDPKTSLKIEGIYERTEHKRHMPVTFVDTWWKKHNKSILVIDCQNDFISGSLACTNAENAVNYIVDYLNNHEEYEASFSLDAHSIKHCSFIENGGTWPVHCVGGTKGYELHEKFNDINYFRKMTMGRFLKGTNDDVEEYSAFNAKMLTKGNKTIPLNQVLYNDVIVCGIATEFCVKETVKDLINNGFNVSVLEQGLGYVSEEGHKQTLEEFKQMGVKII